MLLLRDKIDIDKSFLPGFPSNMTELAASVSIVTDFSDNYLSGIETRGFAAIQVEEEANLESIMVRVVKLMAEAEKLEKEASTPDDTKENIRQWLEYFEEIKKRICVILGKGDEETGLQNLFKKVLDRVIKPALTEFETRILEAIPSSEFPFDLSYFDQLEKSLQKIEGEKMRSLKEESILNLLENSIVKLIVLKQTHKDVKGAPEKIKASLALLYKLLARNS